MRNMDQDSGQSNVDGSTPSPSSKRKCKNCTRCQNSREKIKTLRTTLAELNAQLSDKDAVAASVTPKDNKETPNFTATQEALQTAVVVRTILKKLSRKSLLGLRLVCRAWEEEATFLLLSDTKSFTPYVWTHYSPHEKTMGKNGVGSLDKLIQLIRKGKEAGRRFPSSRFGFVCPNLLACPQLTQFFIEQGQFIHILSLDFSAKEHNNNEEEEASLRGPPPPPPPYAMIMDSLRNLFFKWAPNVKHMFIGGIPWPEDHSMTLFSGEFPQGSVTLPNLKILHLGSIWEGKNKRIAQDIMMAAPNLERVIDPFCHFTDELIAAGKAGARKNMLCCIGWSETVPWHKKSLDHLKFQVDHFKRLESLNIGYSFLGGGGEAAPYPQGWIPQVELLNQILENNKGTLKKITAGPLDFLPDLCIPPLTKVKVLDLDVEFRNYYTKVPNLTGESFFRLFPRWLDLEKTFPNISTLILSTAWRTHYRFRIQNPPESALIPALLGTETGTLPSVKKVVYKCRGSVPHLLMEPLAHLVPNVESLNICYDDRKYNRLTVDESMEPQPFPLFRAIWKHFPDIKQLQVSAHSFDLKEAPKFFNRNVFCTLMDSWVTGLDVETIRRLRNTSSGVVLDNPETMTRVEPSILDMKNLKYLEVAIDGVSPLFSFISATHGFDLMKNFRVVCKVKGQTRGILDDPQSVMKVGIKVIKKGE